LDTTTRICKIKPTQEYKKEINLLSAKKKKDKNVFNCSRWEHAYSHDIKPTHLETTLSMIISRQGMFTDKHVTIYKNI
jgi:hypothetical protein